jgi:hypothetical protein
MRADGLSRPQATGPSNLPVEGEATT